MDSRRYYQRERNMQPRPKPRDIIRKHFDRSQAATNVMSRLHTEELGYIKAQALNLFTDGNKVKDACEKIAIFRNLTRNNKYGEITEYDAEQSAAFLIRKFRQDRNLEGFSRDNRRIYKGISQRVQELAKDTAKVSFASHTQNQEFVQGSLRDGQGEKEWNINEIVDYIGTSTLDNLRLTFRALANPLEKKDLYRQLAISAQKVMDHYQFRSPLTKEDARKGMRFILDKIPNNDTLSQYSAVHDFMYAAKQIQKRPNS